MLARRRRNPVTEKKKKFQHLNERYDAEKGLERWDKIEVRFRNLSRKEKNKPTNGIVTMNSGCF